MKSVGIIPARLESTRLPGKLLLDETGWPLLRHTWEAVRGARLDELWVATDNDRIAESVWKFGGHVVMTGCSPNGTDRVAEAVRQLGTDADLVVNIQGDEPEIAPQHIHALVRIFEENPDVRMATLAAPLRDVDALADPACTKVVCGAGGRALYFSRAAIPHCREARPGKTMRANEPPGPWLLHLGVYAYRPGFLRWLVQQPSSPLEKLENLEQLRALEAGADIRVAVVDHSLAGIDTPADYERFVARCSGQCATACTEAGSARLRTKQWHADGHRSQSNGKRGGGNRDRPESVEAAGTAGPLATARNVIAAESRALDGLAERLDDNFTRAVQLLEQSRGRIVVIGVGKAGLIGRKLTATLSSTGMAAFFLHPTEARHGDLGGVQSGETALVLSKSGETEEILRLLPSLNRLNVPIVAVTTSRKSSLGRQAGVAVELGDLSEADPHELVPTTSTTAMLALGDALALALCEKRSFTPEHFAALHPGGSLGRRLTPVRDVMRRRTALRIASERETVRHVLTGLKRPGRRTGAVMLVDESDRLCGIFTDSDLARLLEARDDERLDGPVAEVMTRDPLTISADATLDAVVERLSTNHISELPVVDEDHRPLGLIDITDVLGLLPATAGG